MANRAYLFSDDRPDAWHRPEEAYYDSCWNIPLAWFFFFRPEDVRLVDVDCLGSRWQEVRFSAEKAGAIETFERRESILRAILDGRLGDDAIARFRSTVAERPGRYLILDPDSILGGLLSDLDDSGHAERLARILSALGEDACTADLARDVTGPYVGELPLDPEKLEGQVLGWTY